MLLVIIVSVGVITIVVVVIIAVFCTRRTTSHQKKKRAACKSVNGSHKYKGNSKDVKPPDLWIHHERLELKPIDKSPDPNPIMTDTPIPRNSQDITPVDNSMDSNIHQRRNSYRGHESEDSMSTLAGRRGMRPKMMMPFDSQPPQPVISAHPIHSLDHPHHHFHSAASLLQLAVISTTRAAHGPLAHPCPFQTGPIPQNPFEIPPALTPCQPPHLKHAALITRTLKVLPAPLTWPAPKRKIQARVFPLPMFALPTH